MTTLGSMTNPIKEDPELRRLLAELNSIETKRGFNRWKKSFVERFSTFLSDDGEVAANQQRNIYKRALGRFVKIVQQLEGHISSGELSLENVTVKARKCLAEFQKHLNIIADQTNSLIPGTGEEIQKFGYTKFHMGAVLIKDGFEEYDRLSLCAEIAEQLRRTTCLPEVADKQVLEEMDNYVDKFGRFCDIMADLGLHSAMLRCHALNEMPDEPESEPEPETKPEPEPETETETELAPEPESKDDEESDHSMSPSVNNPVFKYNESFKTEDSNGRLEMQTKLHGSFASSIGGSKNGEHDVLDDSDWTLNFPGIKPPSGPFIKYLSPEEYNARKKEREEAARLKKEKDEIAYKPVQRPNFGLGNHYHGSSNFANVSISCDLDDNHSSGTESPPSTDSEDETKKSKKKKPTKKVVVKKVVKKKVLKKKPKSGGTTENSESEKPEAIVTKPSKPKREVPPVHEIKSIAAESTAPADDDDLTSNTLSPKNKIKTIGTLPPVWNTQKSEDSSSSSSSGEDDSSSSSDDGVNLGNLVDFDRMEGVKGMKRAQV